MGNTGSIIVIDGHALRIKSLVGEGARGCVYLVEDEARRKYALKQIRAPKDEAGANHLAEMEIEYHTMLSPHPNLVRFVGSKVDKTSDTTYHLYHILTEYCPKTILAMLETAVKRKEPIPERDVLHAFTSACAAVSHIHESHIAHRDVKVENLLVGGIDGTVKLCDLGSCSTDHRRFRNGTEIGYAQEDIERHTTLAYRAPEQVDLYSGRMVGEKVDIWALGVLLYKLCWWRTPFEDKTGTVSPMAILNGSYSAPPSVSSGLPPYSPGMTSLIKFMLQPDPENRPTALQVLGKVRDLMDAGEIGRYPDLPALASTPSLLPDPIPLVASEQQQNGGSGTTPGKGAGFGLIKPTISIMPPVSPRNATTLTDGRGGGTPRGPAATHTPNSATPRSFKRGNFGGNVGLDLSTSFASTTSGGGGGGGTPLDRSGRDGIGRSLSFHKLDDETVWRSSNSRSLDFTGAGDLATIALSTGRGGGGHQVMPSQMVDISDLATVNRAAIPRSSSSSSLNGMYDEQGRPRNPKKALGVLWQRRMQRLIGGGEKGKRSWVVKATSKEPGQPKAKYVRKIVLAIWEQEMSSSTYFIYLYQRPVQANPVIALKGLTSTLKILQQGPKDFLAECVACVGMVDEIGKHWGNIGTKVAMDPSREHLTRGAVAEGYTTTLINPSHGAQSPSHRRQHLDAASIDLLAKLARLLVQKLYFHEQHPSFATHFTAIPTMLGYETVPVTGQEDDMKALSRLLTIQDSIIQTQRLVFAAKNESVATTARWALLPLIEEAYTVFVATTFLLATLLELSAQASGGLPIPNLRPDLAKNAVVGQSAPPVLNWRERVTALLALREQYDGQLTALQTCYNVAERVEEVKAMKRVPTLPASNPVALDGALNWKPSTMRSPMMRELGYLDRARVNEEMGGDDGGTGTDGPPTPRSHRGTMTPTNTAAVLAHMEGLDDVTALAVLEAKSTGPPPTLPTTTAITTTPSSFSRPPVPLTATWESFGENGFAKSPIKQPLFGGDRGHHPPTSMFSLPPPPIIHYPPPAPASVTSSISHSPSPNLTPAPAPPSALNTATETTGWFLPSSVTGAVGGGGAATSSWAGGEGGRGRRASSLQRQNEGGGGGGAVSLAAPIDQHRQQDDLLEDFVSHSGSRLRGGEGGKGGGGGGGGLTTAGIETPATSGGSVAGSFVFSTTSSSRGVGGGGGVGVPIKAFDAAVLKTPERPLLAVGGGSDKAPDSPLLMRMSTDGSPTKAGIVASPSDDTPLLKNQQAAAGAVEGEKKEKTEESWATSFLNDPRDRAGEDGSMEDGDSAAKSLDLLAWSASSSDDEEEYGNENGRDSSIAALTTENMSRIIESVAQPVCLGTAHDEEEEGKGEGKSNGTTAAAVGPLRGVGSGVKGSGGHPQAVPARLLASVRAEVVAHAAHPPLPPLPPLITPPAPTAPPSTITPTESVTAAAVITLTATPTAASKAEDRIARAKRKEARSQPWRTNMKPAVAVALTTCIREFEASGTLIGLNEIVWGDPIGHGAFATVYRGFVRNQDVAVKKLITQNGLPMAEKSVRDFASEVSLLRLLHHPNIITLVGTCADPVSILTEFCHKGNLFMVLNEKTRYKELSWSRKLSIARGLADGMHYLHTRNPILIHRDLKSLNVLLNKEWVVKITDFGLSRFKPHSLSDIMTMQCGTYHWMAPEVINSTKYTEKADVYSFGIILWEIFTRSIPYDGMQPVQVVAAVINRVERPPLPADCPPEYAALVRACWAHDAAVRPAFSEIVEILRRIPE